MKGKNLKKKIAYILTLVLLFTSVYVGNFSYTHALEDITNWGLDYSSGKPNQDKIYKAGNGSITYKADTNTLILDGATINTTTGTALNFGDNYNEINIVTKGKNEIISQKGHAIQGFNICIKGESGSELNLISNDADDNEAYTVKCHSLDILDKSNVFVTKSGADKNNIAIYTAGLELKDSAKLTAKEGGIAIHQTFKLEDGTELNAKIVAHGEEIQGNGRRNFIGRKYDGSTYVTYTVYGNVVLNGKLTDLTTEQNKINKLIVPENTSLEFNGAKLNDVKSFNIENKGTIDFINYADFVNPDNEMDFKIENNGTINVAEGKNLRFDLRKMPTMTGTGQFINKGIVEFKAYESTGTSAEEKINTIKNFVKNEGKGIIKIDQGGDKTLIGSDDMELAYAKFSYTGIDLTNQNKKIKFIPNDTDSLAIEDKEAYILYDPQSKELTLNNIYYRAANITLPNDKITIKLIGKNILYSQEEGEIVFKQGENIYLEQFNNYIMTGTMPDIHIDRGITFTGDGSLNIFTKQHEKARSIQTDGYIKVDGGKIYRDIDEINGFETQKNLTLCDKTGKNFVMTCASYSQNGGYVMFNDEVENSILTFDFNMTGGKFLTAKDTSAIQVYRDLEVTGGEFKPSFIETAHILVFGDVKNYTINDGLIVGKFVFPNSPSPTDFPKCILTVYGNAEMAGYDENGEKIFVQSEDPKITLGFGGFAFTKLQSKDNSSLTIKDGQTVGCNLYATVGGVFTKWDIKDVVSGNAAIINNGKFFIRVEPLEKKDLDKKIKEIAIYLKMHGNGKIVTMDKDNKLHYYNNDGSAINAVDSSFNLDFNNYKADRETPGLSWKKDTATNSYILTLDSVYLDKNQQIILPQDEKIIIKSVGKSKIDGQISSDGTNPLNLTVTGDGTLNLNNLPSGSANNDTITIDGGVKVYVKDRVACGGSGGEDGFLNIKGKDTLLDIDITQSSNTKGTFLKEINVTDGAKLNIRSKQISAYIYNGSINVKNNSTLKVSCKYGVYIYGGKLTVDDTSTLQTDATSAGIVVVDPSKTKTQDEVLSIPDIPYNTNIVSVMANDHKFWTIAKIGSAVEVVGNNADPADDIKGALGKMTIKKRTDITGFTAKLDKAQYEYTGSPIKAGVTVKDSADKTLTKDKDYIIEYQNNINPTTATNKAKAIVTGIGDYKGEITLTFDIVKKSGGGTIPGGQSGGGSSGGGSQGGGSQGGGGTSGDVTPKNNDITKDNKQEKNKAENKVDDKKSDIKKFDDVNKDDWYYDSVIFVSKNGYMTGISENKFAPMMSTSRAMISQIIYNLEKTPKTTAKHNFTDVAKNVWYEQSLNFTFDKDIVAGFPDKTFRGNSTITREQLTKILYQYAIYKGYNSDTDTDMSKYEDFEKAGDWSKISIKWAVKHNIIKGRTSTSLDPKSELTRAELAAVLKNFHSEFVK